MKKTIKNIKIDNILMFFVGMIFPWSILSATPQLHIGYWGQVEGMIVFNHILSAIVAILLLNVGLREKELRKYFSHPIVLIPALIGVYSVISACFQRLPVFAMYGSPQLGQGAFWYFSLSLLTVTYFYITKTNIIKLFFIINFLLITLVISIGSFYPTITGIVISFFGFNDWLAIYFTAFFLSLIYLFDVYKLKVKKEFISLIVFFILGPLFWKIDNNSSIALWLLISFAWIIWLLNFYYKIKIKYIHEIIYNPIFFTLIPVLLSILMVLSSFTFWDGKTDMTDKITDNLGHLATLVARGSIVRVLFEHLFSFKALLIGFGWGSISELLIKSFTPEVFYQINTGNRVHFHTHNEFFEHIFSIGLIGALLYVSYIYNIFRYSFKISISIAFIWLLYFCIGAFWFSWISSIAFQAMLAAYLITQNFEIKYFLSDKINYFFSNKYFYSFYLIIVSLFLFFGAYIGYFTASNHENNFTSDSLIKIAKDAKINKNCSKNINDFGKGALQYSQKFNGFSNYYKDQVLVYGVLNETDYLVLEWYLCSSDEIIKNNKASLELINVHINALSMISVLPGELGKNTINMTKKYIDLWEEKLKILFNISPQRSDQATPLIAYYLKLENDYGIKRVCNNFIKSNIEQSFCDLAIGSIYIKEGQFNIGISFIKKANEAGVLDSGYIDQETGEFLKALIKKYSN